MTKIQIIIPTYNEVNNIGVVIEGVEELVIKQKPYDISIIVVDDLSPDGTASLVKDYQKKFGNIEILSGVKQGLGKAYMRAFNHILEHTKAKIIIMMDADLSHKPEDLPRLIEEIKAGADYVIGSRYTNSIDKGNNNAQIHRKLISRFANAFAHKLIGINDISDMTSGYKAIRRSALESVDLKKINGSGYVFQVSLLHLFLASGLKVKEIPTSFDKRHTGKSKLRLKDITEFLYVTYKLSPTAPIQKFVRFCFVGGCGTLVNLLILALLVKVFDLEAIVAIIFAIEVSIVFNFFLNHYYTFKRFGAYKLKENKGKNERLLIKLSKYNLGALGGALISFVSFTLFYKAIGINYLISDILGIVIALSWNYFISTKYVWKIVDE